MHAYPSCRAGFTPADMDFMAKSLGSHNEDRWFSTLMEDPDSFDKMLEDPKLFRALLEKQGCVKVSLNFYFYVLILHALQEIEMKNLDLADYLAGRLCRYSQFEKIRNPLDVNETEGGPHLPLDYLFEVWAEAERSGGERRFQLQLHLGDIALFWSGLFPKLLFNRTARRAAPGIEYYEKMGSSSYHLAGQSNFAHQLGIAPLLLTLCQGFHATRLALNKLSEKWVFLDHEPAVSRLLNELGSSS